MLEIELTLIRTELTYSSEKDKISSMINYAICEISGKQYKVVPGKEIEVDFQEGSEKDLDAKVLLLSKDDKLEIGAPYLKEALTLKYVENGKGPKIRVSKFHAKANYRKTIGHRAKITTFLLPVKKA